TGQLRLGGRRVQRIIEPGDGPRGVAERRMGRHVVDPLAIDPHLPAVPQAFQVFGAGERPALGADCIFRPGRAHAVTPPAGSSAPPELLSRLQPFPVELNRIRLSPRPETAVDSWHD